MYWRFFTGEHEIPGKRGSREVARSIARYTDRRIESQALELPLSRSTRHPHARGGGSSHNIGNTDLPPTRKEDRKVTVHIYNLISRRFFNIFFFSTQTTTVKNKVISKKGWQVIRRLLLRIGRFYGFFFF